MYCLAISTKSLVKGTFFKVLRTFSLNVGLYYLIQGAPNKITL